MILIFGPTIAPPLWLVIAILAMYLVLLAAGLISTFLVVRGVYLLLAEKTTAKIRLHAAVLALLVSITLLLALAAMGYFRSSEILVHILSFPFGLLPGNLLLMFVWLITGYMPGKTMAEFWPVAFILNVFLNYAGYITLVDFFTKRFGKKLSGTEAAFGRFFI